MLYVNTTIDIPIIISIYVCTALYVTVMLIIIVCMIYLERKCTVFHKISYISISQQQYFILSFVRPITKRYLFLSVYELGVCLQ